MNTEDHDRLSRIFLEASELEPDERVAFLDRACAGAPELRAEVESMLAHAEDLPEILQTGLVTDLTDPAPEDLPDRIGAYRILEKLGEGGMGVVFRAEQERPIRRQVAVKLIRLGFATEEVLARFETERQALAIMNHPNIARVLDAGATEQGRPYFAMEYVDGEPIVHYCDRHRLGLHDRLELFRQVCRGIQHAHQKAIIHRDIKASNVLVTIEDGRPVPKIIDFGVAKALEQPLTDRERITGAGRLVGTLESMSPEQAAMNSKEMDTRTDVYSLGFLLYELLVGVPPFDTKELHRKGGLDEVRRAIREESPSRLSTRLAGLGSAATRVAADRNTDPSSLTRRLRGDLDWITMKAMEKEPARRYASPAELAADIDHHLSHEPVLAGPPGAGYRMKKFVRKHRLAVGFAAALTFLLLTFVVTVAVQAGRIAREARRANQEAETSRQVSEFLVGLFQVSPGIGPRVDTGTAWEMLEEGTERIREEFDVQPVLQARLLHTMGDVYRRIGLYRETETLLLQARARLDELLGPDHPETLSATRSLARHYQVVNRFGAAEALYRQTLDSRRRLLGEDHPDSLRSMNDLAYLFKLWDRDELAEPLFEDTVERLRRVLGRNHPETLIAAGFLAGVYLDRRRFEPLEPLLLYLVDVMPRVLGEKHGETLAAIYNLGCLHALRGEREEALRHLARAVELGFGPSQTFHADPNLDILNGDPEFERLARRCRFNEQLVWRLQIEQAKQDIHDGAWRAAEARYRKILEGVQRTLGREHYQAWDIMCCLADLYIRQGRYDEAEALLLETLDAQRRNLGDDHYNLTYALTMLAQNHVGRGDRVAALALVEEALRISEHEASGPGLSGGGPGEWGRRDSWRNPDLEYFRAARSAVAGDREGALRHLRNTTDWGFALSGHLGSDLLFSSLHDEPEFQAILRSLERKYDPQ